MDLRPCTVTSDLCSNSSLLHTSVLPKISTGLNIIYTLWKRCQHSPQFPAVDIQNRDCSVGLSMSHCFHNHFLTFNNQIFLLKKKKERKERKKDKRRRERKRKEKRGKTERKERQAGKECCPYSVCLIAGYDSI